MEKFDFDFTKTEYLRICEEAMLKPEDRLLLKCKVEGLTYIETGNICGMSPDNVKKRIAKLKKKILKVI